MTAFWDVASCGLVEEHRRFNSLPWWWRQYAPLKRRSSSARLHGAVFHKAVIFTHESTPQPHCLRSILILPSHVCLCVGFTTGLFASGFPTKMLYVILISSSVLGVGINVPLSHQHWFDHSTENKCLGLQYVPQYYRSTSRCVIE
jgi:hypothetical protein